MVRTVRWGQVSDHSFEPEGWNEFDIEDTAEKPESKDQLPEDGNFTDVPQLKLCPLGTLGVGPKKLTLLQVVDSAAQPLAARRMSTNTSMSSQHLTHVPDQVLPWSVLSERVCLLCQPYMMAMYRQHSSQVEKRAP